MLDGGKPRPYERPGWGQSFIKFLGELYFSNHMTITSERMAGKKPNPVDAHVGSRVRLRRMLLGMSQERLGESMGLTFQQVQKYEKGVNRIGASRLFQISKILDVPVQFFFEEAPHVGGDGTPARGMAEPDSEAFILEFLNSREGLELNRAFVKIPDPKVRKSVVDLVRALSASAGTP
jgi:transcriptional regulator with XRE-family HTH domain